MKRSQRGDQLEILVSKHTGVESRTMHSMWILDEEDTDLGQCVKCKLMQCMHGCSHTAAELLIVNSAGSAITL